MEKSYFWMKLRTDFYRSKELDYLEKQPRGREIELLYLKLLCESIPGEGVLFAGDDIPLTPKTIAAFTRMPVSVVKAGLPLLQTLGMLEKRSEYEFYLPEAAACLGEKAPMTNAERQARYRRRKKEAEARSAAGTAPAEGPASRNEGVTEHNDSKSKSKNQNQNQTESACENEADAVTAPVPPAGTEDRKKKTARRFTAPTRETVAAYCRERGNSVDADRFMDHYTANGWMVGKNPMRDWQAAVRTWERNGVGPDSTKTPPRTQRLSDLDDFFN